MQPHDASHVSFGFRDVRAEEKQHLVRGVFDAVAQRYNVMNDLMSGGLHRAWKKALVAALRPKAGMALLDLAGGTGDIAFRALARTPDLQVALCDINAAMLGEGRKRAYDRNCFRGIDWVCGDAQKLPFPDRNFDACTIAFRIRNVTSIPAALAEIHRVLKPGGRFLCLEFCPQPHAVPAAVYDFYSFRIMPPLGKLVTGDGAPYRYLAESIRRFPEPERFAGLMRQAAFGRVTWRAMSGGLVALHRGWRI